MSTVVIKTPGQVAKALKRAKVGDILPLKEGKKDVDNTLAKLVDLSGRQLSLVRDIETNKLIGIRVDQ